MKTVQLFAAGALLLSGVAFTGCDKKPETTPPTSTSAAPDMGGATTKASDAASSAADSAKDAAKTAGDKIEAGAKKAENAADNALKDLKK